MAAKGSETVTVRRVMPAAPGSDDDFYGSAPEAREAGVAVLDRCIIWPRASSSDSGRGVTTIEGLHIFVPHDEVFWDPTLTEQELLPEDKVTARGQDWELDGAVGDWRKKRGNRIGFLFEVKRWSK